MSVYINDNLVCVSLGAYGCPQNANARGTLEWNPCVRNDLRVDTCTVAQSYVTCTLLQQSPSESQHSSKWRKYHTSTPSNQGQQRLRKISSCYINYAAFINRVGSDWMAVNYVLLHAESGTTSRHLSLSLSKRPSTKLQTLATKHNHDISATQSFTNDLSAEGAVSHSISKLPLAKKMSSGEKQKCSIQCSYCEEKFAHRSSLSRHINRQHKELQGKRNIVCNKCPAT